MRKNNSSLLLTILGGAIFCFVFLGMAFIYTNGTKIMEGNNELPLANNDDEIKLGDTCDNGNGEYGPWTLVTDGYSSWTCGTPSGPSGSPPEGATGSIWHGTESTANYNCASGCTETCYRTTTYSRTCLPKSCESFDSVGDCPSRCYAYDNGCHTNPAPDPVVTCSNKVYNGQEQSIATCNIGVISNHKRTNVGSQSVTCTNGDKSDTKTCSISKATASISNTNAISLTVGESKTLLATSTFGTISYSINSGNAVTLSGSRVTGFVPGTATIRATVDNDNNYNGATADITVTVTAANSEHTCPAGQGWDPAQYRCSDCAKGYYSGNNDDDCHECPANYVSNTNRDGCIPDPNKCGAGQGKDSNGCSNCPAGTYSPAGDNVCHKCTNGKTSGAGASSCTVPITAPCCIKNESSYTQLEDAQQCAYVASLGSGVTSGACPTSETCKVSISTVSVKTSVDNDEVNNSYYTVVVNIDGADCIGQKVTYTATNVKEGGISPTSYTVQNSFTGTKTVSFTVKPKNPCSSSRATATLTNGSTAQTKSVTILKDWVSTTACEQNPKYTSFEAADRAGANVYYSDRGTCADGTTTGWTKKWTRAGCPSSGSTITNPKCYSDDNNGYHWTTSPEPTWKIVSGISNETFCGETENEACYVNPNGEYQWGQYAKTEGYTLVTSIDERTICLTQEGKCYKNANNKYVWSETKPNACIQVNTCWVPQEEAAVEQTGECAFTTQEACETEKGYTEVTDVTAPKDCAPQNEACYIRESDGVYKWGDYANVTGYYPLQYEDDTPVPEEMCSNEVPDVPKTSMDVTKIVYICMAVLMAAGVGFIYYSTVMKKQND